MSSGRVMKVELLFSKALNVQRCLPMDRCRHIGGNRYSSTDIVATLNVDTGWMGRSIVQHLEALTNPGRHGKAEVTERNDQ